MPLFFLSFENTFSLSAQHISERRGSNGADRLMQVGLNLWLWDSPLANLVDRQHLTPVFEARTRVNWAAGTVSEFLMDYAIRHSESAGL